MTETTSSEPRITVSGGQQQLPPDMATPTTRAKMMTPLRDVPSLFGPAAPIASPQESVSVIIRLTAAQKLSSPTELLSYEVADGAPATPQKTRGVSLRESELTSPQLHASFLARSADVPADTSAFPLRTSAGADGGTDAAAATAAEVFTPSAMPPSLPRAFASSSTQPSKRQPLPVTAAPTTMKSTPPLSLFAAEASTAHLRQEDGSAVLGSATAAGSSIGSCGRVLTITSPTTRDRRQYEFGEVLGPEVKNSALCNRLIPSIMEQMVAGYNVCVLCYGQTRSENTRTMNALALRVAEEVFRFFDVDNDVVEMSYIQVYENEAYNLLGSTRAGKFGAELSRPRMSSTGSCLGSASEPKVLIRSSAEMLAKVKAASRLRVTHTHVLSARGSGSFSLLSLHITQFLNGVPLTTVRVTLADVAATETPEGSGAVDETTDQAIAINKSLMELRQLVESCGKETEVLHFHKSMLTTYLAPHVHGCHLILLVAISLETGSYDEAKSSLELATKARLRKVTKMKSGADSRLLRTVARFYVRPGCLSSANAAGNGSTRESIPSSEFHSVVEVLQHRIGVLEDALKITQQRGAVTAESPPLTEAFTDVSSAVPATAVGMDVALLAHADALQRESTYYHELLQERERGFLRLQSAFTLTTAESCDAPSALSDALAALPPSLGDDCAGTRDDQQESATPPDSAGSSNSSSVQGGFDEVDADDVHTQLRWCVCQLRSLHSRGCSEDEGCGDVLDRLHSAAMCAGEQCEDMTEQLLVAYSLVNGLRVQSHRIYGAMLRANERFLAADMERKERSAALQVATLRATTAETALEQLRLQLFQAYAEQSIREEMTRLYLDAKPIAANVDETVSGARQTEQQVELEKVQAHQQVLCDKITELVDNVEQLTRAAAQRDISLATLESLITPAQRALFYTLSNTTAAIVDHRTAIVGDGEGTQDGATAAAIVSGDDSSAADCFSLLQSRVSELSSLLMQEQQQHQLTQCELLEAREDARRSRQEQRQAFFQQQEEARRVGQLIAENFELRQQNERHQLYLDEMYVGFHEKLQQLRQQHEDEVEELRTAAREARFVQRGRDGTVREGHDGKNEDNGGVTSLITARAPARRNTLQGVPQGEECLREGTTLDSNAMVLLTADAMISGGARHRPSRQAQRSGQVRSRPNRSNERRRGEVHGIAASGRNNMPATQTAAVLSLHVEQSSKAARRSASTSKIKRQLFSKHGESPDPICAATPLKSGVVAFGPPAARRRNRMSAAAEEK